MISEITLSDLCLGERKRPHIIFHQGDAGTLRGNTRGYLGIAQSMERYMDAHVEHVKYNIVDNPRLGPLNKLVHKVVSPKPKNRSNPDIALVSPTIKVPGYLENAPKIIHKPNMHFSQNHGAPHLVPHDLTPEKMRMAGRTFRQKMLGFPQNFILVGISSWNKDDTVGDLINDIKEEIDSLKQTGPVGAFLINGPRLSIKRYNEILEKIKSDCNNAIAVKGFNSARRKYVYNGYNPYLGALSECSAVIYRGHSYSMESEIIYSGKKIIAPLSELRTIDPAIYEDRETIFSSNKTIICGTASGQPDETANITHHIAYTLAKEWATQRIKDLGLEKIYKPEDIKELRHPWV